MIWVNYPVITNLTFYNPTVLTLLLNFGVEWLGLFLHIQESLGTNHSPGLAIHSFHFIHGEGDSR